MGIHWTELLVVSLVALLIFGPKRLPEMGGAIGRTYKEFKKSLREVAEASTSENAPSAPATPALHQPSVEPPTDDPVRR